MEKRKPNVPLTIALVLLVLAAIVALVIFLITTLGGGKTKPTDAPKDPDTAQNSSEAPADSQAEPTDEQPSEQGEQQQQQPVGVEFDAEALQAALDDSLDGLTSSWQVVVVDVASGKSILSRVNCTDNELMVAADLPELFIMATVYQQLADGKLTEDQVATLLQQMIQEDQDSASNELTKLLGGGDAAAGRAAVNEFAKSIGCEHVEFNRLFGETGTQNYVTASDCATLLQLIASGNCVSAEASQKMVQLMTDGPGERIPNGAPAGSSVAHLNANMTGTCCADAGIVTTQNGKFVIVIICNNPFTNEGSTKKCVELTQIAAQYLG